MGKIAVASGPRSYSRPFNPSIHVEWTQFDILGVRLSFEGAMLLQLWDPVYWHPPHEEKTLPLWKIAAQHAGINFREEHGEPDFTYALFGGTSFLDGTTIVIPGEGETQEERIKNGEYWYVDERDLFLDYGQGFPVSRIPGVKLTPGSVELGGALFLKEMYQVGQDGLEWVQPGDILHYRHRYVGLDNQEAQRLHNWENIVADIEERDPYPIPTELDLTPWFRQAMILQKRGFHGIEVLVFGDGD